MLAPLPHPPRFHVAALALALLCTVGLIQSPGAAPRAETASFSRHNLSDADFRRWVRSNQQAIRSLHRARHLRPGDESAPMGQPGSDDASDDYDVLHYTIDIDIDTGRFAKAIDGSVEILLKSLVDGLSTVELDLHRTMAVSRIEDGQGAPLLHRHPLHRLHVELSSALAFDDTTRLVIHYGGSPANNLRGFDIWRLRTPPVVYTICEPNGAHRWWPCKDRPDDKAPVKMNITMDAPFVVAANGLLESVDDHDDGTRTHRWSTEYPLAPYLVAIAATDFVLIEDEVQLDSGVTLPLHYYTWPEDEAAARIDVAGIPDMMKAFGRAWFPYPFATEKYGHMETPLLSGAMEHTTMTSYGQLLYQGDRSYDPVAAHELAHHWWGDLVTCATWDDIWLNEGFATYGEAIYYESEDGYDGYLRYMDALREPLFLGSVHDPTWLFSNTVYQKGAWVLHMLRGIVGRETTQSILAEWGRRYAHQSAVTAQFTALASEVAGEDLSWFFDPWLYHPGRPHYEYGTRVTELPGSSSWVRFQLDQVQGGFTPYRMPITARLSRNDGSSEDVVLDVHESRQELSFQVAGDVIAIEMDPDGFVLGSFQEVPWTVRPHRAIAPH